MKKLFVLSILITFLSCSQQLKKKDDINEGYWNLNGVDLYYKITGDGQPLLVLHGGPGLSHKYLFPQVDSLLSDNFQLIFYDQRASGWSGGKEDTAAITMENFVEDLENIRQQLGFEKLNLMGHSFGGLLAMYYGIKYPQNLNSLVLIDSDAASWELRTPYQIQAIRARLSENDWKNMDNLEQAGAFARKDPEMIEKYFRIFLKSYFYDTSNVAKLQLGFDKKLVSQNETTSKAIRDDLGRYDIHDQLQRITCPALVMIGRQSVFSVESARAIVDALPDASLLILEKCGHFEFVEQPEQFRTAITGFYDSIR